MTPSLRLKVIQQRSHDVCINGSVGSVFILLDVNIVFHGIVPFCKHNRYLRVMLHKPPGLSCLSDNNLSSGLFK